MKFKSILFFIILSQAFTQGYFIESPDTNAIRDIITGENVYIYNINIDCHPLAYGRFGGLSDSPTEDGLLLTTGQLSLIMESNNSPSNSTNLGYNNDEMGINTYDGCFLSFNVVSFTDSLQVTIAFGSEEYPEYIGTQYIDEVRVFFNLLDTSITANSINHISNSDLYHNNSMGQDLQFDGYTKEITLKAQVTPWQSTEMKFQISDSGDAIYDSGLFIKTHSLRGIGLINTENELTTKYFLYPNPTSTILIINSSTNIEEIKILDAAGKLVINQFNSNQINIESLSSGIYFAKFFDQGINREVVLKFVKN